MRPRITFKRRVLDVSRVLPWLAFVGLTFPSSLANAQDFQEEAAHPIPAVEPPPSADWLVAEGNFNSCDLDQARARIHALIHKPQAEGLPLSPHLTLRGDHLAVSGEAKLAEGDKVVFLKSVTAEGCADVLEALIFSLEIYLEKRAASQAESPQAPPEKEAPTQPDNDPFAFPDPNSEDDNEQSENWTPMVLVGLLSSAGDLPTGATGSLGGTLLARIPVQGAWFLTGEARHSQVQPHSSGDIDYRFSKMGFHLGPGIAHRVSPGVALRFDSSLAFHLLKIALESPAASSETTLKPSVGAALHGALSMNPWRALAVEVRGSVAGLFLRGRYLSDQDDVVWQEPWGSFSAGVLLGWGGNAGKSPGTDISQGKASLW